MKTLRQRLREKKINCLPWNKWKGEIDLLPISAKSLFSSNGLEIDKHEIDLKEENYLLTEENLLEILKVESNLKRVPGIIEEPNIDFGSFPDDWSEEDFIYSQQSQNERVL